MTYAVDRLRDLERDQGRGFAVKLADRVTAKLRQGVLATTYGARNVRMDLDGPLKAA